MYRLDDTRTYRDESDRNDRSAVPSDVLICGFLVPGFLICGLLSPTSPVFRPPYLPAFVSPAFRARPSYPPAFLPFTFPTFRLSYFLGSFLPSSFLAFRLSYFLLFLLSTFPTFHLSYLRHYLSLVFPSSPSYPPAFLFGIRKVVWRDPTE